MIKLVTEGGASAREYVRLLKERNREAGRQVETAVAEILETVRRGGDGAVRAYAAQFDGAAPETLELPREKVEELAAQADPAFVASLKKAAANIRDFHARQKQQSWFTTREDGVIMGQRVRGLKRVGLYVPGGTAAYPSSVLMNAVPAKVAGVEEIIMVTPPTKNLNQAVLAAAKIAGVDRVIGVGGTQAIAALTYGAGFIPKVDKICGPGNAYVAAAKRLAYGAIDIDMVAGPSEVLVIADETSNPKYVAADLLSQAEHYVLASAVLLTTSEELARAVDGEIVRQTGYLSRKDVIAQSLRDFGAAIVCPDLQTCADLANEIAPEHLEICTKEPRAVLPMICNAGAVFLGENAPEPLGDYMAGPNHVLPTSGTARFFSPLSVESFLKSMSILEYSRENLEQQWRSIVTFAKAEFLTAHANSIEVRFEDGAAAK